MRARGMVGANWARGDTKHAASATFPMLFSFRDCHLLLVDLDAVKHVALLVLDCQRVDVVDD